MSNVTVQEALKNSINFLEAFKLIIEKLEPLSSSPDLIIEIDKAKDQCKSALSEIEKCEPVGYGVQLPAGMYGNIYTMKHEAEEDFKNWEHKYPESKVIPLYTSPQPIEKCEPVYLIVSGADEIVVTKEKYDSWTSAKRISYTSPISKEWVGLSDSEWVNIVNHDHAYDSFTKDDAVHYAVKATEAKLKQLNTKG